VTAFGMRNPAVGDAPQAGAFPVLKDQLTLRAPVVPPNENELPSTAIIQQRQVSTRGWVPRAPTDVPKRARNA
jgi:hypothetical protein